MNYDEYIKNSLEERAKEWDKAKVILDSANARPDKSKTVEEQTAWEAHLTRIDALDEQRKDFEQRKQSESEATAARAEYEKVVRPDVLDRRDEEAQKRLINFLVTGEGGEIGKDGKRGIPNNLSAVAREKAALRNTYGPGVLLSQVRNDLAKTSAGAGADTVPTSFERTLYDYLEVFSGMRRTNATILTTTSGENYDIPKVASHGTAAIVGEGSALAEADPAFAKVTLGAWKYAQLLQITYELTQDTGVDIMGFIAKDTARALARATDTKYVLGTGTNEPTGLFITAGTGVTGIGGSTGLPSYQNLVDLVYSVNEEYRMAGAQWLMRDATVGRIRGMVDTTGQPIWQPSTISGTPDRLLGYPVVSDPNVAAMGTVANCIGFGDCSPFYIRDVGSIRFERSDEYAFANDLITFRSVMRTDSKLVDTTGAFKVYHGGTN